ncbi:uncharacterized protein LOC121404627 [Drosophila obscura]|uniref:uncharacterized protein LOC121404627 n=1 Tax=Drosophila obscura TaxID=7282 RepID=UPI001BB2796D|nr:uncharacterized protein LOC121404627 [Drosophila obscura]
MGEIIDGLVSVTLEKRPATRHGNQIKDTLTNLKELHSDICARIQEQKLEDHKPETMDQQTSPIPCKLTVSSSLISEAPHGDAWSTATRRPRRRPFNASEEPEQRPKATTTHPPRRQRHDAIIIATKGDLSYSDILRMVTRRDDGKLKEVGKNVDRVRRTAKGELLLELNGAQKENTAQLKEEIGQVLGTLAGVRALVSETFIEIRDIDDLATKEEVAMALSLQVDHQVEAECIRALRPGYGGSQVAVVGLADPLAKRLLEAGKLKIGWTRCRIVERSGQRRCYKCLEFGHIAARCKSDVDRSNCCLKCGKRGHKVAECTNDPRCFLCTVKDPAAASHIAGSKRCPRSRPEPNHRIAK